MRDNDLIRRGDGLVEQAIAELQEVVHCRCHEAYTGRGLHDPDCQCDSQNAVHVVAARIAALTAERDEAINQLDSSRHSVDVLEKRVEKLGRDLNVARYGQPDFAWSVHKEEMAALRAKLARIASAWPIVRDADCSGGTLASAMDEIEAALTDGAADE